MRLPDEAMGEWYRLLLDEELPTGVPPRDAKRALARRIVERFHGPEAAADAERHFDRLHVEHRPPEEIDEAAFSADGGDVHLPALIADVFGGSRSDARRLLAQGGVRLDGEPVEAVDLPAGDLDGRVLQVGRRRFRRLRLT
jgi:tyrosyl-tRNA synthetase